MRRLVVWNLMTLDGYSEGKDSWNLGFHHIVQSDERERHSLEQAAEIGTLLFGRFTYEGMAAHWRSAEGEIADFMNTTQKFVVSGTLAEATWTNSQIISADPMAEIAGLKQQLGKDVFVFGSAELAAGLLKDGLVDETLGPHSPGSPRVRQSVVQALGRSDQHEAGAFQTAQRWHEFHAGGGFDTTMRLEDGTVMEGGEGCFLELIENERIVFTDALQGGWRPNEEAFFSAVIMLEDHPEGALYTATALHKNDEDRQKHAEMGFVDGSGTVVDQIGKLAEKLA